MNAASMLTGLVTYTFMIAAVCQLLAADKDTERSSETLP